MDTGTLFGCFADLLILFVPCDTFDLSREWSLDDVVTYVLITWKNKRNTFIHIFKQFYFCLDLPEDFSYF